jgi:hypothetical protein
VPRWIDPLHARRRALGAPARAAFLDSYLYLRLAGELGALYTDEQSAGLYPARGRPALAPWRLALVAILRLVDTASPIGRYMLSRPGRDVPRAPFSQLE